MLIKKIFYYCVTFLIFIENAFVYFHSAKLSIFTYFYISQKKCFLIIPLTSFPFYMIIKAYIHEYGNNKIEPEHSDVKTTLEERGIICELFTEKRLFRNQLKFDEQTLVVGNNPIISNVLKRLGINYINESYPESLKKYLERNIWESTIRKLLMENHGNYLINVFVKPKSKAKLFTGFVINSTTSLYKLDQISKNTDLYCSSVVEWLSEFRVFVMKGKIVGIKNYDGDSTLQLNMEIVENAINDFENSPQKTDGYGIDFGILKNGKTALVEWNDGFALGSYKLDREIYTDLIIARWEEILKQVKF